METLSITKANALSAFKKADKKTKELLAELFGKENLSTNIIERVKTLQDACIEIGKDYESRYGSITEPYKRAETDIEIFAEALRESKPAGECFYYPYFLRSSGGGFSCCGYVIGSADSGVGARLRVDTPEKAKHLGNAMLESYKIMDKG